MPPLIAIVGETASGKSALAMKIARHCNGAIIAADSRTIYKGMDIGTAKPSVQDQAVVPHYGLDLVLPDQPYSAAAFQSYVLNAITDITAKGKVPILVGGTGLYVDAVIFQYEFGKKADQVVRSKLEQKSIPELQALIQEQRIAMPTNPLNKRHLIRQLETGGVVQVHKPRPNTLVLGVTQPRDVLKQRIQSRVDTMISLGLEAEVRVLQAQYGWEVAAMNAVGYREFKDYIAGHGTIDDVRIAVVRDTMQLAKRQRTWFRRNKSIHWVKQDEYVAILTSFMNKYPL